MLDLLLAIGHHLLILGIFGIICAEFWDLRAGLSGATRWRKSALQPSEGEIQRIRRYLHLEVALFMLLPVFAAAMARGYGEF